MDKISTMLDEFAVCYEVLHPRARIAILGIASTALKLSMFKIDNETETLLPLLPSACVQGRLQIFLSQNPPTMSFDLKKPLESLMFLFNLYKLPSTSRYVSRHIFRA